MSWHDFHASFRVFGEPKGQPRPRAFKTKEGQVRVYDPGTAEAWKSEVLAAGFEHRPETPLEGPVTVEIRFLMKRPQALMRPKDPEESIPHDRKPDLDNLGKAVLDALVGGGWMRDDKQVYGLYLSKYFHAKADSPGAWIEVYGG